MIIFPHITGETPLNSRRSATALSQVFPSDGERCWIIRISDIFLLESEGNYTRVLFAAERPLIRRSLNALEQQLDVQMFFRANRRQLINLKWIESTSPLVDGSLMIRLAHGFRIELSRRRSDELRTKLRL